MATATALLNFQGVAHGRQGIVLVFTDGENNFGRDPVMAVRQMHDAGHRGYFIGVDLPDYVVSRAEARRLAQAFAATGGRHYEARGWAQLRLAYHDVSALEPGSLKLRTRTEDWPVYGGIVVVCLVLTVASLVLHASPSFVHLN